MFQLLPNQSTNIFYQIDNHGLFFLWVAYGGGTFIFGEGYYYQINITLNCKFSLLKSNHYLRRERLWPKHLTHCSINSFYNKYMRYIIAHEHVKKSHLVCGLCHSKFLVQMLFAKLGTQLYCSSIFALFLYSPS